MTVYISRGGTQVPKIQKKIQIDFWKWFFWQKMMKIEYFCMWNIEWNLLKWPSRIFRLEQYYNFTLRNTTTHRFNDENPTGYMQDLRCVNGVGNFQPDKMLFVIWVWEILYSNNYDWCVFPSIKHDIVTSLSLDSTVLSLRFSCD